MYQARAFIAVAAIALLSGTAAVTGADNSDSPVQQNSQSQRPNIVPPPSPQELTKGKPVEPPGISITHYNGAEFDEYRIDGRVYAVKIIPRWGLPYWFYDINGDELIGAGLTDPLQQPPQTAQWQILSW